MTSNPQKDEYYEGLRAIQRVFNKFNITFWLEGGTLIGAMREGQIISWDRDTDVSFYEEDVPYILDNQKEIQKAFRKYNFEFGGSWRFGISRDGQHIGCILPVRNVKGYLVKYKAENYAKMVRARADTLGYLAYITLKTGDVMPIPQHAEDYLQFRFPNWKTPHKYKKNSDCPEYNMSLKKLGSIALFPARMNPPHVGHIMTLLEQLRHYSKIYICLYDDGDRVISIQKTVDMLRTLFIKYNIEVRIEKTGFRFRNYFGDLPAFGVVISGNSEVIKNCEQYGIPAHKIERFPNYEGTKIRKAYTKK